MPRSDGLTGGFDSRLGMLGIGENPLMIDNFQSEV